MKNYILILLSFWTIALYAQNGTENLTKSDIKNDLAFLEEILQNKSSYQGLNGYDYKEDFNKFLERVEGESITKSDLGWFLSKTIGKIGDRHSFIKGYELPGSLFFPLAFAPYKERVLVVEFDATKNKYDFWNSEFPYLKSINKMPIDKIISQMLPGEVLAPKSSYFTLAVRELRDIETIFKSLNIELSSPVFLTLANENGVEMEVNLPLVSKEKRTRLWDERFFRNNFQLKDEQYKDKATIEKFFTLKNNIAYIQIADMIKKEDNPVFFQFLSDFMTKAKGSDALIIDVRDNGGGTRHLIQELAGYFIHSDSVYIVNVTKQRGELPLNRELRRSLNGRFLFSKKELDRREQNAASKFMTSFKAMYDLDSTKFSEYYYYVLNGQKLTKNKYHYNKPIYILANEKSFSAASVLVSVFKDLPNIKIVGVNTDGSSGNSERFELPNSKLRGKISTMVSFQKNGQILDGIGTKPDIVIERNVDQVLFKEDGQLNKLVEIIRAQNK